ncbi:MAG: hypothetical protein QXY38_06425 [Archaeoglobaceae archaeon]
MTLRDNEEICKGELVRGCGAIIREALAIKGREEGLSKEEFEILLKASGVEISRMTQMDEELHEKVLERERRREKLIRS